MCSHETRILLLAVAIMLTATVGFGAVPSTVSYQGQLLDSEGDPITGTVSITFAIHDDSTGGTQLWLEGHPTVDVESGVFSVVLGPIPDSVFSAEERWLEIIVNDEQIDPRTRLTAMPYTFAAKSARSVSGDITTEPGELMLSDAGKDGSFVQMRAHSSGNDLSMYMVDPADESGFAMYDWNGGQPQALMEMKASANSGGSLRIFGSDAGFPVDPMIYMGVEPVPFIGGRISLFGVPPDPCIDLLSRDSSASLMLSRLKEGGDRDSLAFAPEGFSLFESSNLLAVFSREGLAYTNCGDGKGDLRTTYGMCGFAVDDTTHGETLMVANELGVFIGTVSGKADWDAYLTADSFKMSAGAADGYVLTSDADGVGSWQASSGGGSGWTDDGAIVRLETIGDNVGIGTTDPNGKLHVQSSELYSVYSRSLADTGIGGYFEGGRKGIQAYAGSGSGYKFGVFGQTLGSEDIFGYGVYGVSNFGNGCVGVGGVASAGAGSSIGVVGRATGSGGTDHTGVSGYATHADTTNIGVLGQATGGAVTNYGIKTNAWDATSTNYGIYAEASGGTTNYAGYFVGDVHITGTLTGGNAGTRIDHPLDPDNKYLQQSFVESPDMKSVYDGNVVTDADGLATVKLPEYCEALNSDFRYQLTAIGSFSQVIVKQEIENNQFVIASAQPNVKVSWQVTGIRKDAFAEANRTQVEIDKPDNERGLYMYPEALGYGEEMQIHYQLNKAAVSRNRAAAGLEPDVTPLIEQGR